MCIELAFSRTSRLIFMYVTDNWGEIVKIISLLKLINVKQIGILYEKLLYC